MRVLAKTIVTCFIACISACGGGSRASKVEYSDEVAGGTVANYINADWLYQNYFGDYGLPSELKPNFMPALQMLANGFALQLETKQDVKSNIEQVHSMFLQYAATSQMAAFFSQLKNDAVPDNSAYTEQGINFESTSFVEPVISEEDQLAIKSAKQRDLNEELDLKATARKYKLPYEISNHKEQWFIYSPSMKGGGKGGRQGGGSAPKTKSHANVTSWGWRPGDIVWVNGQGSITGVPGHTAIVFGGYSNTNKSVSLVEANTDVGVAMRDNIQVWMDKYTEVRALTPRLSWSYSDYYWSNDCVHNPDGTCWNDSDRRMVAWAYARDRIGLGYNWNFTNPRDEKSFYCTSLIWNAYKRAGYNVIYPTNFGDYQFGIITPNQIRDTNALLTFKVSII